MTLWQRQTVNSDRANWRYILAKSGEQNADRRGVLVDDLGSEITEVTHQRIALHLLLPGGIPAIECLSVMRPKVLHHKCHRTPEHHDSEESEQDAVLISFLHITETLLHHSQHGASAGYGLARGEPGRHSSLCFRERLSDCGIVGVHRVILLFRSSCRPANVAFSGAPLVAPPLQGLVRREAPLFAATCT